MIPIEGIRSYAYGKKGGRDMAGWLFAPQDDKGCWWYCENCGALLNAQPGFTTAAGRWICIACGEENDVGKDNIQKE